MNLVYYFRLRSICTHKKRRQILNTHMYTFVFWGWDRHSNWKVKWSSYFLFILLLWALSPVFQQNWIKDVSIYTKRFNYFECWVNICRWTILTNVVWFHKLMWHFCFLSSRAENRFKPAFLRLSLHANEHWIFGRQLNLISVAQWNSDSSAPAKQYIPLQVKAGSQQY